MADSSHEISVDNAIGAANSSQSPSARALSRVEPPQSESGLFSGESVLNILKLIFTGAPLADVLTIIARLVEAQGKGMFCTIWLLDKEGGYVHCATAPSLPGFITHWGRTPVGPDGACCGTAVYRREPVYSTDILSDPLWDSYRHLVAPYGVRAVWARPLFSSEGKALGTFAILYRNVGSPSATDLQLIENASHIVGIAIERHLNEKELRRSEAFLAEAQRLSVTGSFSWRVDTDEITWSEELYRIFEFDRDAPVTLELIGSRVHPEDIPLLNDMIARARGIGSDFEYEHCLRMLATDPPNVDGARDTARRTIRDGNRLSDVITRLRALFSKKETTFESLDLNEAIREVIALSLSELHRSRVILRTELADNLPLVTGDRVQLQQVVLNLLRNASDAMSSVNDRPRHIVITTEREEGDRVRLTVQDEGVGLDPQAMDRLFEAFYTTKNEGMGMGLSISRSIIERHHGRLWAAPNDGPGATFSFSIPCGLASATGARSLGVIGTPAVKDAKRVQGNP